ncbi:UDP-N-acetylmuramoyl-tripeptide--D-alanyl-D-alanine ligase [Apilactobacillus apinorum]|uniref:UDP-N-acetylmuramoyl-tripeptide--D-alanyl-D- alanine ligase n=1 Tax=Apilactobacillus apinorum TaxID=1218495 RepID=UPI0006B5BF96|nr:UDP-N-acetylmuramoyl-tripeptide--D-alanyl-D-alanine ligase [Apilactobacillus apinorum]KOY69571.1 UDP-N-acetylmuramoyl-tripeptide--D-alanyl-D-alanine ligase [Apilactobacillus apinorum]CAI2631150.1 Fhon1302860UDP-N-acetylmuramoyl-tripeptide--D-alanyl-D-alanineligase [Apilactobacillus apinorum]
MKMSLTEVSRAVAAQNDTSEYEENDITSVAFDSRQLEEDALFVPLVSENDGHDYIQSAIKNGAVATFWQADHENVPTDIPVIIVNNTLEALQMLSQYYLAKINPKVVAITGSNGKTTTKDMVASVLSTQFNVTKTNANFNNEIGVPMTILDIEPNTEILVVEMGMDRPGQLDLLSHLVEPDVAAVTMIGEAHIEFFGTRDKIADAKMEIVNGLKEDGIFVYNGDEPLLAQRSENLPFTKTFGLSEDDDFTAYDITSTPQATSFKVKQIEDTEFKIPMLGSYNVNNALVAIAIGSLFRIREENMAKALLEVDLTNNRTEWIEGTKHEKILSDVYNSNPTAVKEVLKAFTADKINGRKIAVLGDMLELGDQSSQLHASLADSLNPDEVQSVYLIGDEIKVLYDKLVDVYPAQNLFYFKADQLDDLYEQLNSEIYEGDEVLLKASHGIHLEQLLAKLTD